MITVRTPAQIAAEINSLKSHTDKIMLVNSIKIGHCLTEAKAVLPYGEWGKWLQESVSYSQRTANYLMQIYREFGPALASSQESSSDSQPGANLSFTQAVLLLEIPAEERAEFMACHDVETMSKRELQEAVKEKGQAEEKNPEAEGVLSGELIPVIRKPKRLRTLRTNLVQPAAAGPDSTDSTKYDAQYAEHRDGMIREFEELRKTLDALNRIDPARKEVKREETFKILTNLAAMMKEYPPPLETNLNF